MNVVGITTSTADRKQRAGQRLIIGIRGAAPSDDERAFIRDARPGGFILFARNVEDPAQVRELNRELAAMLPVALPPIRCVDQEGGRVQRVKSPATVWPPMRWVGNVGDLEYTGRVGRAMAREVLALGFDLDFSPVADVNSNPANPVIGDRAFGTEPRTTARHVAAFIEGMQDEGCIACAKHFPGHGDTATDSHLDLPVVERDIPELEHVELVPFRAALRARVGTVMTAHVTYPAWDPDLPATMSSPILRGLLRERLRYRGVVVSDDLEMKAVRGRFPLDRQLRAASAASVDTFLVCEDIGLQMESWEALIRLQEEDKSHDDDAIRANRRWHLLRERFLKGRAPPPPLDILGSAAHESLAMRAGVEGRP